MDNDLLSILNQFTKIKILVVGEVILDSSVRGKAGRLALEGPAPVIEAQTTFDRPGGAAQVALNACRLDASVEILSVIGQDVEGDQIITALSAEGISVEGILRHPERQTLLKRRIYADAQLVARYDQGTTEPVDGPVEKQLLDILEQRCSKVDVVVLSDYGQGIFTQRVLAGIAKMQQTQNCILVTDTRRLEAYQGLRLAAVRPSYYSALEMLNEHKRAEKGSKYTNKDHNGAVKNSKNGYQNKVQDSESADPLEKLSEAGEHILQSLDTQMVAITLDDNGALVLDRDTPVYRTYAPKMPFNRVSGAGDAFIAGLALSLAAGAQAAAAGEIASAVASIVVEKEGQAACCLDELKSYLGSDQKLIEDWPALAARLEMLREQGKKIVFTNGVFDILHSAHVSYLNQAKSFGDVLVIGVNTDQSVKRLKGPSRPINNLLERCRVLAGLSCVDFVSPFGQNNPINLIHYVKPDVYVKGGDYTRETLPEAEVVEKYGGVLRIIPYIANHSTTGVIERIRKRYVREKKQA